MGKIFDKIILSALAALVLFLGFHFFTGSYAISTALSLLTLAIFLLLSNRKKTFAPSRFLSKRDFIRSVLLNGNEYLKALVERALASDHTIEETRSGTILKKDGRKALVCYAYKFGSLSEEDVAKCYRLAKSAGADEIYALTNHTERKALAVTAYIPQRFTIIGAGTIYKYLMKKRLIPEKTKGKTERKKAGVLLRSALTASNAKYFVFAGFSTALVALLTPFAVYYIAFAFLDLILASLSLILSEKDAGKNDLFS